MPISYDHKKFSLLPGIVGVNNIKANDYMNMVLHTLANIGPLRDYFLSEDNYHHIHPPPGDQTFVLGNRGKERECVCLREIESVCVCVCVTERDRERERERQRIRYRERKNETDTEREKERGG